MKGMFQLPVGSEEPFGGAIAIADPGPVIGELTHTITNRRLRLRLHVPEMPDSIGDGDGDWRWVALAKLGDHPHPSWVRKALEMWARSRDED